MQATIGDSVVMIGGTKGRDHAAPAPAHLYLLVDDVDASFRQALDAGATAVPGQVLAISRGPCMATQMYLGLTGMHWDVCHLQAS